MKPELMARDIQHEHGRVRLLEGGSGPAVVLLHGGAHGGGPLPASAELWGDFAVALARGCRVVAIDLPGSGGSVPVDVEQLTPGGVARTVVATLGALRIEAAHLVAHDECALAALALARGASPGVVVRSCALLAPAAAAPSGDQLLNLALLNRPQPRWSRRSLLWTVRRLSAVEGHIDAELVDRLERNAASAAHTRALELLAAGERRWALAAIEAQTELFEHGREHGFDVPLAIVWGAQDPRSSLERVMLLHALLSGGSATAALHVLGRCGHLPHREQPYATARLVSALVASAEARRRSLAATIEETAP